MIAGGHPRTAVRSGLLITALFALCATSASAPAHHSRAEFTTEVVELEGELVAVQWVNPHPTFKLRVSGETWDVQVFGGISVLTRGGVEGRLFSEGQHVRIAGNPSSRRPHALLGTHVLLPDGLEAVLHYGLAPRWSERFVGGLANDGFDPTILAAAAAENRGIFRVWSAPSTSAAIAAMLQMQNTTAYTDTAVAARDRWDMLDNPITRCESGWMPHVMFQPSSREFVDHGRTITLTVDYLGGTSRTIHMQSAADAGEQPQSRLGFSRGWWEGKTLVVETTRLRAPAFDSRGSLQSEEMMVTERFTLSDDQSRVDYELVMNDPVALAKPARFEMHYLALGRDLERLPCVPQ